MTIIAVIAPVFLLVLAGYLAATSGVLKARDVAVLSRFVFNIALPVLLFQSLATVTLPEQWYWHFLLVYYINPVQPIVLAAAVDPGENHAPGYITMNKNGTLICLIYLIRVIRQISVLCSNGVHQHLFPEIK